MFPTPRPDIPAREGHSRDRYLGRCAACFRPVKGGDTVSFLQGELYHRECARYRSESYPRHKPPAQR